MTLNPAFYRQRLPQIHWQSDEAPLPLAVADWLLHTDSLTQKLQQICGQLQVQVTQAGWQAVDFLPTFAMADATADEDAKRRRSTRLVARSDFARRPNAVDFCPNDLAQNDHRQRGASGANLGRSADRAVAFSAKAQAAASRVGHRPRNQRLRAPLFAGTTRAANCHLRILPAAISV